MQSIHLTGYPPARRSNYYARAAVAQRVIHSVDVDQSISTGKLPYSSAWRRNSRPERRKAFTKLSRFLPHDAMRKRGICCRPVSVRPFVCLSARLSRWWIVSTRLKISLNFFLGPVTHHSIVFWPQAPVPNSKGNPFNGGVNAQGCEIFAIFDWIAVYLENGAI